MDVSKEYVARQVREVIRWRESWLDEKGLPRDTFTNEAQREQFLKASKDEYHNRPDQRILQERDRTEGPKQLKDQKKISPKRLVDQRKKSRWAGKQQRLAGTTQMWHVLSFTGKFDAGDVSQLADSKGT